MESHALMSISSRTGLFGVALLAACTIRVQQSGVDDSPDAECLQLFETCVELAGESPGCTEVYQFCKGSVADTDSGGVSEVGGCEQTYIDCLEEGTSAEQCQPLLDMCMPPEPEPETTTGTCLAGDPGCPIGDGSTGIDPSIGCPEDEPDCVDPCEANFLNCLNLVAEESVCLEIQDACQTGDCVLSTSVCEKRLGDTDLCRELTGCSVDPNDCSQILEDCTSQGLSNFECSQLWPDRPECFSDVGQCEWYSTQCLDQFADLFCADAGEACSQGFLSEVFDCTEFFQNYCSDGGVTDNACTTGEEQCQNGFFDTVFCNQTPLWQDPYLWLQEIAECNNWGA